MKKYILLIMLLCGLCRDSSAYIYGSYYCFRWYSTDGAATFTLVNDTDESVSGGFAWSFLNDVGTEDDYHSPSYNISLAPGAEKGGIGYYFDVSHSGPCEVSFDGNLLATFDVERDEIILDPRPGGSCDTFEATHDNFKIYVSGGYSGGGLPTWSPLISGSGEYANRSGRAWRLQFRSGSYGLTEVNIPYGDISNPSFGNYGFSGISGGVGVLPETVDVDVQWGEDTNNDGVNDTWHDSAPMSFNVGDEFTVDENGDRVYDLDIPQFEPPSIGADGYADSYAGIGVGDDTSGDLSQDDARQAFERALENQELSKFHIVDALNRSLDSHGLRGDVIGSEVRQALQDQNLSADDIGSAVGGAIGEMDIGSGGIISRIDAASSANTTRLLDIKSEISLRGQNTVGAVNGMNTYLSQLDDYASTDAQKQDLRNQLAQLHNDKLDEMNESISEIGAITINPVVEIPDINIELDTDLGAKLDSQTAYLRLMTDTTTYGNYRNFASVYRAINENGTANNDLLQGIIDALPDNETSVTVDMSGVEEKLDSINEKLETEDVDFETPEQAEFDFTEWENAIDEQVEKFVVGKTAFEEFVENWKFDLPTSIGKTYEIDVNLAQFGTRTINVSAYSGKIQLFRDFVLCILGIIFLIATVKIVRWAVA